MTAITAMKINTLHWSIDMSINPLCFDAPFTYKGHVYGGDN